MKKCLVITLCLFVMLTVLPHCSMAEEGISTQVTVVSTLEANHTLVVRPDDTIRVISTKGNTLFYYCWDKENVYEIKTTTPELVLKIPSDFKMNTAHLLYVADGNVDELSNHFYQVIISEKEPCFVSIEYYLNDERIIPEHTYEVMGGETLTAIASTEIVDSSIAFMSYYFVENGQKISETITSEKEVITITIPEGEVGTEKLLLFEAVDMRDDSTTNFMTKTGWQEFCLQYVEKSE